MKSEYGSTSQRSRLMKSCAAELDGDAGSGGEGGSTNRSGDGMSLCDDCDADWLKLDLRLGAF